MTVQKWEVKAYQKAKGMGGAGFGEAGSSQDRPAKKIKLKITGEAGRSHDYRAERKEVETGNLKLTLKKPTINKTMKQAKIDEEDIEMED